MIGSHKKTTTTTTQSLEEAAMKDITGTIREI